MPSCPFAMKDLTRTCEGGAFRVDADMMLVRQLEDDCVWKTVNLVSPVDFGVASFMAKEGLTSHGMSVRQVDLLGRVCDAWSMLIRCESLALDERMFNRYRDIFSSPSLALPNEERSEDEAIRAFLALWASDQSTGRLVRKPHARARPHRHAGRIPQSGRRTGTNHRTREREAVSSRPWHRIVSDRTDQRGVAADMTVDRERREDMEPTRRVCRIIRAGSHAHVLGEDFRHGIHTGTPLP